jgi:pimeloyl-ACP methyl ester carboxylesterase
MIFVLPGMGADSTMFDERWKQLPDVTFVNWPPYAGDRTLTEIAARIVAAYSIHDGSVVVGTSLGGMVACEIARLKRLERLALIASATHPDEISLLLKSLRPLTLFAPIDLLCWSATSIPGELTEMFSRSQPAFIRAMIQAIFKWNGLDPSLPAPLRIHGKHDRVITPPHNADLLLEGGHLIAMTHAQACCDCILDALRQEPKAI